MITDATAAPTGLFQGTATLLCLLAVPAAWWSATRRHHRLAPTDWLETASILALATLADPLFSIGLYFLVVHGFRQCELLGAELFGEARDLRARLGNLVRVHGVALPLLVPSWLALGALAVGSGTTDLYGIAALTLGLYAVVTWPHHWLQVST